MLARLNQLERVPRILRLDIAGQPVEWVNWRVAVCLYARDLVKWTLGDFVMRVYGGFSALTGKQGMFELNSIIACDGRLYHNRFDIVPPLTNKALFARDRNLCMYCGYQQIDRDLTRDHIVPRSRGGDDKWTNVVAACRRCNTFKGNRLPHECNLELIALPFEPNRHEYLALTNSGRILGDQLSFLERRHGQRGSVRSSLTPMEFG